MKKTYIRPLVSAQLLDTEDIMYASVTSSPIVGEYGNSTVSTVSIGDLFNTVG